MPRPIPLVGLLGLTLAFWSAIATPAAALPGTCGSGVVDNIGEECDPSAACASGTCTAQCTCAP